MRKNKKGGKVMGSEKPNLSVYDQNNFQNNELIFNALDKINKLNGGVMKNLQEKRFYNEKFKNPFEPYIKKIYDIFLKSNNQISGIKSYNLVVNLLIQDYQSKINSSVADSS